MRVHVCERWVQCDLFLTADHSQEFEKQCCQDASAAAQRNRSRGKRVYANVIIEFRDLNIILMNIRRKMGISKSWKSCMWLYTTPQSSLHLAQLSSRQVALRWG